MKSKQSWQLTNNQYPACSLLFNTTGFFVFGFLKEPTLLSLLGNLGRLIWVRLQQPQEQRYPILQVHAGSLCFCNPPNSDMDYRIFNVHTRSFLYVNIIYTRGFGTLTSQHNIFDSEKLSHIFFVLMTGPGFKPPVFGSRVQHSTN